MRFGRQRSDEEARTGARLGVVANQLFRLAHHPALPAPTVSRAVAEVLEAAGRLAGLFRLPVRADASSAANLADQTRPRVLLSQEWSGTRSVVPSRRNSRSDRLSAQRHSRPRSLSIPSK